jgi:hypothetical protein
LVRGFLSEEKELRKAGLAHGGEIRLYCTLSQQTKQLSESIREEVL